MIKMSKAKKYSSTYNYGSFWMNIGVTTSKSLCSVHYTNKNNRPKERKNKEEDTDKEVRRYIYMVIKKF